MGYQTINPATEENLALFPYKEKGAWKKDLERLYDGFISYQSVSFKIRKSYLMNLNKTLLERRDQLAEIISIEMGKPIAEARGEIEKCAWLCSFYANEAAGFLKDKKLKTNGTDNRISYGPLGIVFGIMPWNYPFWQVFRFACPALIAGNAVIIKHAPNVPQCAMSIEALFNQAGFTEELFQQWFIKVDDVAELIKDPRVRGVSLTGSESAGSAVGALAGKYIKPAVMELGGSDPFIVFKDADLEEAVKWGVASRMLNAGQSCIAAKRFIIHQDVYDEFVRLFVAKVKSLKLGDPLKIKTQIGPLARKDLLNNLNKQVSLSVKMGAKLKCGGSKINSKGFYFEPTVLTNVKSEMPVMKEEVFGPVAVFVKFKEEVEALLIANDTQYGLGASIWTKDKDKAITIASQIEAGSVFINQMVKSDPRLPFGGIKRSGYGRELAREGLLSFVNTKTISIN